MSRNIHSDFQTAVISNYVRPFVLFQAFFDTETVRFWNGLGSMIYNSDTFTGAGNLLKLSGIEESTKVEARGATLTLSGVPQEQLSIALNEEYQGRKVAIDLGFFRADGTIIPPFRFFSGKADIMAIRKGGQSSTISLTVENDIIILQRVNERRRTAEDQKLKLANDTFMDNVAALQNKSIVWE